MSCLTICWYCFGTLALAGEAVVIYKYFDAHGVLHLTNKPPAQKDALVSARSYLIQTFQPEEIIIPLPAAHTPPAVTALPPSKYDALIESAALRHQVPAALIRAVIKVESSYRPTAVSPKGAVGLMQLMPATARRYGVAESTDPAANIEGGTRYLKYLLTLFNGNIQLVLAAYNAGEHAVIRYGNKIPPYAETQHYVVQVMRFYQGKAP